MDGAEGLLALQDLDLKIRRVRERLAEPEQAKALRKARSMQRSLNHRLRDLRLRQKDLELEIEDARALEEEAVDAVAAVRAEARSETAEPISRARQRELDGRYGQLAKQLERVTYKRERLAKALDDVLGQEAKATADLEVVERALKIAAAQAREAMEADQREVAELEATRNEILADLDGRWVELYETSSARFDGLGVERLKGNRPSVCSMALSDSEMDAVRRHGPVTQCPYCKRVLIVEA